MKHAVISTERRKLLETAENRPANKNRFTPFGCEKLLSVEMTAGEKLFL